MQLVQYIRETSKDPEMAPRIFIDIHVLVNERRLPDMLIPATAFVVFTSSPNGREILRKTQHFWPRKLIMNPWTHSELKEV